MLKVRLHKHKAEWDKPFPQVTSTSVPDTPQDMVGFFGCQYTLLIHIQHAVKQNSQIIFHGSPLLPLIQQSVLSYV